MMTEKMLRDAFRALGPGGVEAHGAWTRHGTSMRNHVLNGDDPHALLRWSTLIATMVVGETPLICDEFDRLPRSIVDRIHDSGFGDPPMLSNGVTSANYCHQAFHLHQMMELSGVSVADVSSIIEFGGGYGSMAVVARALGFTGSYTIYDLPEISLIQQYYLSNVGCAADTVPITSWHNQPVRHHADMLIACYSISETRADFRDRFFDYVNPDVYFIAHQQIWEGERLDDYFEGLAKRKPYHKWQVKPHFHGYMVGHKYRVGVRQGE